MRLKRNIRDDGKCKYGLIRFDRLPGNPQTVEELVGMLAEHPEAVELTCAPGSPNEFFVIRLQDSYAPPALQAYADAARADDPEYAAEVAELAGRSGEHHSGCKQPD